VYCSELPASQIEQITEIRDRAFLAIKKFHHLLKARTEKEKKSQVSYIIIVA
jgi:hypothetical protein